MDNAIKIISVITSIVSAFFLCFKKNTKKEREYYNDIVLPFIVEYKRNSKIVRSKIFIPPYIHYLYDNNEKEKLEKVLIYDYLALSDNQINMINKGLSIVSDMIYYFFVVFSFIVFLLSIIFMINSIVSLGFHYSALESYDISMLLSSQAISIIGNIIYAFIVFAIAIALTKITITYFKVNDRYTISKKHIKNSIDKKINKYPKILNKYYF